MSNSPSSTTSYQAVLIHPKELLYRAMSIQPKITIYYTKLFRFTLKIRFPSDTETTLKHYYLWRTTLNTHEYILAVCNSQCVNWIFIYVRTFYHAIKLFVLFELLSLYNKYEIKEENSIFYYYSSFHIHTCTGSKLVNVRINS